MPANFVSWKELSIPRARLTFCWVTALQIPVRRCSLTMNSHHTRKHPHLDNNPKLYVYTLLLTWTVKPQSPSPVSCLQHQLSSCLGFGVVLVSVTKEHPRLSDGIYFPWMFYRILSQNLSRWKCPGMLGMNEQSWPTFSGCQSLAARMQSHDSWSITADNSRVGMCCVAGSDFQPGVRQ